MKRPFTLIELLVVIAIIAILAAMLLPSLSQAKDRAKAAICMANLRSISQGLLSYAQSFDDQLPKAYYPEFGSDPNLNNWVPKIWGDVCGGDPWRPSDTAFYDRFTKGVFRCPLKPVNPADTADFISYAMYSEGPPCTGPNLRLSQVVNPSGKIMVADGGGDMSDANPARFLAFYFQDWKYVYITFRHNARALGVSYDGHVEGGYKYPVLTPQANPAY